MVQDETLKSRRRLLDWSIILFVDYPPDCKRAWMGIGRCRMGITELSRFSREHSLLFGLLTIFVVSIIVYTALRDFVSYLVPFDYFWFIIFLIVVMIVLLTFLYEKEFL